MPSLYVSGHGVSGKTEIHLRRERLSWVMSRLATISAGNMYRKEKSEIRRITRSRRFLRMKDR